MFISREMGASMCVQIVEFYPYSKVDNQMLSFIPFELQAGRQKTKKRNNKNNNTYE